MPDWLKTLLSGLVHSFIGLIVAWAVAHGIDMPANASAVLEAVVMGATIAAYAALTHLLAASSNPVLQKLAQLLTLGFGALGPAARPVPAAVRGLRERRHSL